jgi:ubiquinone biosynthesis monooxygenase Coq7
MLQSMQTRQFSGLDKFISGLDQALHTVFGPTPRAERTNPATNAPAHDLDDRQRDLATRLMRINHAGEVSAQALYQGQAATARLPVVREKMEQAAQEENDHLAWTAERIGELGGHTSWLNPLWYAGSFTIGAIAGIAGDKWSLGFVAETEHQVVRHLDDHLSRLPQEDRKSRVILEQMRVDEAHHATTAIEAGAAELPAPVRQLMGLTSKIMTRTAYWI